VGNCLSASRRLLRSQTVEPQTEHLQEEAAVLRSLVELTLVAEHRRGHGAMYDALAHGQVEIGRLRQALTSLPLPRAADGRIVLAVDVSPWLRSDAPTCADRLFCHVYGRGRGQSQRIPGWPYSFVAALEPGRT
jgi:hypothetical protein